MGQKQHSQDFPWWEEGTRSGMFSLLTRIRPGLLAALVLGAGFFLFDFPEKQPAQQVNSSLGGAVNVVENTSSAQQGSTVDVGTSLPSPSLLGSLFGIDAIDPLFSVGSITPPENTASSDSVVVPEPESEPQRSIYRYLVAASAIDFSTDDSTLGLALAAAEQGDVAATNRIIATLEARLRTYASLIPPAELSQAHAATISILERYIQHMRNTRDRTEGSVETTWNSPQRGAIAEDAAQVTQQIRDIVHNTETVLPPGVLP